MEAQVIAREFILTNRGKRKDYIDGLMQHCSNSIANALGLLQSCTKPSVWAQNKWLENRVYNIWDYWHYNGHPFKFTETPIGCQHQVLNTLRP